MQTRSSCFWRDRCAAIIIFPAKQNSTSIRSALSLLRKLSRQAAELIRVLGAWHSPASKSFGRGIRLAPLVAARDRNLQARSPIALKVISRWSIKRASLLHNLKAAAGAEAPPVCLCNRRTHGVLCRRLTLSPLTGGEPSAWSHRFTYSADARSRVTQATFSRR